jgi:uncharacterized membrane protein YfcA
LFPNAIYRIPDLRIRDFSICIISSTYANNFTEVSGLKNVNWALVAAGAAAGAANGLLGAGGGMILVPLLTAFAPLDEDAVFPASVSIILPICLVSLAMSPGFHNLPCDKGWSYWISAIPGGILAGLMEKKIPVKWLHRVLGIIILAGGVRYLC